MKLFNPLKNAFITQSFGGNANPYYSGHGLMGHPGLDESTFYDDVVSAAQKGVVYKTLNKDNPDPSKYRAVCQIIDNGDGTAVELTYGHLHNIFVHPGDQLGIGDALGTEGNTGDVYANGVPVSGQDRLNGSKAGTHLHFQKRPCVKSLATYSWKQYLSLSNEGTPLYKDADGFYYEIPNFNNGFNGCTDPAPDLASSITASDYKDLLKAQIPLLQKVIVLLQKLINK